MLNVSASDFFDKVAVGLALIETSTGRFLRVNQRYADLIGCSVEELTKSTIESITHPNDFLEDLNYRQRLINDEIREFTREKRYIRSDGSVLWVSVTVSATWNPGESPDCHIAVAQNISARKQAETQLRQSEERYSHIVEGSLQGILIHQDERICFANNSLARMFDYDSTNELIGRPVWETFVTPEHQAELQLRTQLLLDGQPLPPHPGWRAVGKKGRSISVLTSTTRIDWQGRPAILSLFLDVTEQRHVETALRESEQRFRTLTALAPVGIVMADTQENCVLVNQRWCELAGMTPEQSMGLGWQRAIHPDDKDRLFSAWRAARQSGKEFDADLRVITPEGRISFLRGAATVLRDNDGIITGFVGTVMDLTDRMRAEEDRRVMEAQLQQAQKLESLGVMAGGIAHDFNNLLTSILGYADLTALELPVGSSARPLIAEVMNATRRAAALTQQMLAYSGKGRFVVESVDLSKLIEDMMRPLQMSTSGKCVIRFNLLKNLPAVEADSSQIQQVLMNLVINAAEAIGEGGGQILVSTGIRHCDLAYLSATCIPDTPQEGMYVCFSVTDNGVGMSAETRSRIFEPFFTTKFTGRGLGLAAVLGIVRGNGGTIRCDSEPGLGTTFTVLLPATCLPANEHAPEARLPSNWRGNGTVLVVDDEESIRTIASHMLTSMGFTVLTAAHGLEGVEVFQSDPANVRLVLLDITMPHLDGPATLCEMQRIRHDVKVILSSGYNQPSVVNSFSGDGASAFIQKPYSFEDLRTVVRRALQDDAATPPHKL
ncbi:MAG: PAS domain S-box protein [Fuerstia sp.]|nr:PAS domain S-box protein [Fuerstiella sp.]